MKSKASNGRLTIELEQANIEVGEQLKGTVHLEVFHPTHHGTIWLFFKSEESIWWPETRIETEEQQNESEKQFSSVKQARVRRGGKTLSDYTVLPEFSSEITPGHYQFPFVFQTPSNRNCTFAFDRSENSKEASVHAKIEHRLEAEMVGHRDIDKAIAVVSVTKPVANLGRSEGKSTQSLTSWFFLCRGEITVTAGFNDSSFVPGEAAKIDIRVDSSQCKLQTRAVHATISRMIQLKDREDSTQTMNGVIFQKTEPFVVPANRTAGDSTTKEICFTIPEELGETGSVQCAFLKCEYWLSAVVEMDGCFTENPRITIPIQINPKPAAAQKLTESSLDARKMTTPLLQLVLKHMETSCLEEKVLSEETNSVGA